MWYNEGMTNPLPWTPLSPTKEPLDLFVGDLVMWMGKPTEFSTLRRRVLYQVIERKPPEDHGRYCQYRFRTAFDFENPIGRSNDDTGFMTAREMRKYELVDLGILRLTFDNFINDWAGITKPPTDP